MQVDHGSGTAGEGSTCELSDDCRMDHNHLFIQERVQSEISSAKVIDPYGRVDQSHGLGGAERLRGIDFSPGIVPPKAASRRALSRAINALRPACTSAVFSSIPVNCLARSTKSPSRFRVVLMHTSVHGLCISMSLSHCQHQPFSILRRLDMNHVRRQDRARRDHRRQGLRHVTKNHSLQLARSVFFARPFAA